MRKGIRKKAKHDKSYLKELQKENRFKISLENRHQKGQVKGSNEKSQLLEMPNKVEQFNLSFLQRL